MGTQYTTKSASGYNAAPPSDDNAHVASNQMFWSTIKVKLADTLKVFVEAINTNLLTAFDVSVIDTALARTTIAGDHVKTINVTAGVTQSLGDAATMASGYVVTIKNSHTAAITVDLATGADTLNGTAAGSYSLRIGEENTFRVNTSGDGYLCDVDTDGTFTTVSANTVTADNLLNVKTVDIGDWNMDSTNQVSVAHGLDHTKIRTVNTTIRNDSGSGGLGLNSITEDALPLVSFYSYLWDSTNIILNRQISGEFDSTDYNATSYNRGWIVIWYVD
ncbi:MAG: DUF4384 domain-containing protein [Planctomycetes bacterium]|nr:DUF4384 domain-containing protein [Planctomycetota bacterium]